MAKQFSYPVFVECVIPGEGYEKGKIYPVVGNNNGVQIAREDNIFLGCSGGVGVGEVNNFDDSGAPSFNYITAKSAIKALLDVMVHDAADVAPVRHGAWKPLDRYLEDAKCSECGEVYIVTEDKSSVELFDEFCRTYRFCPNCGARMDKENA